MNDVTGTPDAKGNLFCENHAKNEGNICRNKNDIKDVREELHGCIEHANQRMLGIDQAETENHGKIFDAIHKVDKSNISLKMFGLIVGTFTVVLIAILGYQTALIKGASKAHAAAMEKVTTTFSEDAEKIVDKIDDMSDDMSDMKLDINSLQKDVSNLTYNFTDYKKTNDREHRIFRQSITPNAWSGANGTD